MYLSGRILDRNHAFTAEKIGFTIDKKKGDDVAKFPIELTRSWGCAGIQGIVSTW